jgi:hypothetical protein
LTVAESTPGTFFSAFSTRDTHDAQVMPPIPMSTVAVPTELEIAVITLDMIVQAAKTSLRHVKSLQSRPFKGVTP